MKKLLLIASVFASLSAASYALENTVAPTVTDIADHNPKTGLIVGNSYSFYNCGVHGYLRGFTREFKKDWKARQTTISSAYLSWHDVEGYLKPKEGDTYGKDGQKMFDVVLLQSQSSEPISKKAPLYKKYLKQHIESVRKAGSEPIVIMTWAKQDKPEETKLLADAVITAANANNAIVIPVGLAFAESLKTRPDLILHQADKSHPTAAGSYLYGAMLYGLLYKKSPVGANFRGGCEKPLNDADALHLQKTAWKVLTEFYGWKP